MSETFPHAEVSQKWYKKWSATGLLKKLGTRPHPQGTWVFPDTQNELEDLIRGEVEPKEQVKNISASLSDKDTDELLSISIEIPEEPEIEIPEIYNEELLEENPLLSNTTISAEENLQQSETLTTESQSETFIDLPTNLADFINLPRSKNTQKQVIVLLTNEWNEVLVCYPSSPELFYNQPQLLTLNITPNIKNVEEYIVSSILEATGFFVSTPNFVTNFAQSAPTNTVAAVVQYSVSSTDPIVLSDQYKDAKWVSIHRAIHKIPQLSSQLALNTFATTFPAFFKIDDPKSINEIDRGRLLNTTFRERVAGFVRLKGSNKFVMFTKKDDNRYFSPGGGIDDDETVLEAYLREAIEEAGLVNLSSGQLVLTCHEFLPHKHILSHSLSHYVYAEISPEDFENRVSSEIDEDKAGHDGELVLVTLDEIIKRNNWDNFNAAIDNIVLNIPFSIESEFEEEAKSIIKKGFFSKLTESHLTDEQDSDEDDEDEVIESVHVEQPVPEHDEIKELLDEELEIEEELNEINEKDKDDEKVETELPNKQPINVAETIQTSQIDAVILPLISTYSEPEKEEVDVVKSAVVEELESEEDVKKRIEQELDSELKQEVDEDEENSQFKGKDTVWDVLKPTFFDATTTGLPDTEEIIREIFENPLEEEIEQISREISAEESENQLETIEWYNKNVEHYVISSPLRRTNDEFKVWIDRLLTSLKPQSDILEVGSGFGRDADYIESLGYFVRRTDAAVSMVELQQETGKEAELFNPLTENVDGMFDAIFANGVLGHFTESQALLSLEKLSQNLKPDGMFAFSVKVGEGEEMQEGRLRHYWQQERLEYLVNQAGYSIQHLTLVNNATTSEDQWFLVIAKVNK